MACVLIEKDCKHSAIRRLRGFDITVFCMNTWAPGIIVPAGFVVRPLPKAFGGLRGSTGKQYRAQGIGQTGEREPAWSATPVVDGSVTWIEEPLSNDSLFKRLGADPAVQWLTDSAMTVDEPLQVNDIAVQIAAFHAGGTEGETHRVIARVAFTDGTSDDFGIDWTIDDDQLEA